MKQITSTIIFILVIVTSFNSCNGQSNSRNSVVSKMTAIPGTIVSELDNTIWDIYQDRNSNFWFGSKENGVFYFDGKQLIHITKEDGLIGNEIRGFQEDLLGNIFIETRKGVSRFNGQSFETLEIKEEGSLVDNWKLKQSDLWFRIGFDKKGPYRYDGEYLHYLKFPKSPQEDEFYKQYPSVSFSPYGIYSIYEDRGGNMWFGTSSLGLCRFDGDKLSWHYEEQLQTTPSGGSFGVRAIYEDKDSLFWINNTRYRYDIQPNKTINLDYKKEDGVGYTNEDDEMEFPFFLSIEQDDEGDLWMVTYDDGVWRYNGTDLVNYAIKDGDMDVLLFAIFKDNKGVLWLGSHNAGVYKYNGESFVKFEL